MENLGLLVSVKRGVQPPAASLRTVRLSDASGEQKVRSASLLPQWHQDEGTLEPRVLPSEGPRGRTSVQPPSCPPELCDTSPSEHTLTFSSWTEPALEYTDSTDPHFVQLFSWIAPNFHQPRCIADAKAQQALEKTPALSISLGALGQVGSTINSSEKKKNSLEKKINKRTT